METALRLIREASVYEDMMGGYIENGGKDVKLVEKTEEEKETKVLDDAMNEREAYVKTLLEEKLDYSASTKHGCFQDPEDHVRQKGNAGELWPADHESAE